MNLREEGEQEEGAMRLQEARERSQGVVCVLEMLRMEGCLEKVTRETP